MSKTLVSGCTVVPLEEGESRVIYEGEIAIEDEFLAYVGPRGTVPEDWNPDCTIDGRGKVAMPGLVNAHTHAAMSLFRGFADDLPLMEWLENKIWPLEAKLRSKDVYWGTMLSILEMIKTGTTTFADMYFFMDSVAEAVAASGIRACLSRGLIGTHFNGNRALKEAKKFVQTWHRRENGRITTMLGPHAPYTCPPKYLRKVIKAASDLETSIHIHLAETKKEYNDILNQYGKTPVQMVDSLNLFEVPVLAAHCVHLDEKDISILSEKGVGVVHSPESNMKLASGIAPVAKMMEAGIEVALGTDGASSNNNLDLIQEARSAALLQKVAREDPTVLTAREALNMATRNGARALGLKDEIGTLCPGLKADLILINLTAPHLYPHYDVFSQLVYAADGADVDTVIVNGRILMEGREVKTIDEERVYWEVEKRAEALRN